MAAKKKAKKVAKKTAKKGKKRAESHLFSLTKKFLYEEFFCCLLRIELRSGAGLC